MIKKHTSCVLLAICSYLIDFPLARADTTELNDLQQNQQLTLSKDDYKSEVLVLATWKSKVQGTSNGDQLIKYLSSLDSAIVRNSRDTSSLFIRGYLLGTVGCTRSAIVDLSKAIQTDPMAANLYCERGICYMDLLEYDKAALDLNQAVKLNPLVGSARLARARLHILLNKPGQALPDLLSCRNENLEFTAVLPGELPANFYRAPDYYLGVCYEMLDNHEEAIKYFSEVTKDVTGAGSGFIHRYADQPSDAADRISKLQNGSVQ